MELCREVDSVTQSIRAHEQLACSAYLTFQATFEMSWTLASIVGMLSP